MNRQAGEGTWGRGRRDGGEEEWREERRVVGERGRREGTEGGRKELGGVRESWDGGVKRCRKSGRG